MVEDIPIRVIRLHDDHNELVCDGIPQQVSDDIAEFIIFENRLFVSTGPYDRDDGRQGHLYHERFCLRAGRKVLQQGDVIEGVTAEKILDAMLPEASELIN